jgi:hypothetical protein
MASLNKNPVYQESLKGIDFGGGIHTYIEYYETHLGRKPASAVLISMPTLYNYFPTVEATILAQQGITPYVYLESFPFLKPSVRMDLTDIVKGRYNNLIGEVAQESKKFGETFGGFFVSTLHEMNGFWYYWGQSSKFKNSWRRIVDIWEDKGTNQYATWVWHIACPEAHTSPRENTLGTLIHKVHCT